MKLNAGRKKLFSQYIYSHSRWPVAGSPADSSVTRPGRSCCPLGAGGGRSGAGAGCTAARSPAAASTGNRNTQKMLLKYSICDLKLTVQLRDLRRLWVLVTETHKMLLKYSICDLGTVNLFARCGGDSVLNCCWGRNCLLLDKWCKGHTRVQSKLLTSQQFVNMEHFKNFRKQLTWGVLYDVRAHKENRQNYWVVKSSRTWTI